MDVRDKNSSMDSIASARLKSFEAALHTHGLVYGFLMEPDRPIQELAWDDFVASFRETTDEFGVVVDDLDAIQERAKLLQEELAGRVAEETNHNLFVLSIVTAVLLPVTLITGIFGMNVAGLPGLQDAAAFWWVVLGMVAVAVLALVLLHWKRLF